MLDGKPVPGPRLEGVTSDVSHTLVVAAPGYVEQTVTFTGTPLETKHLNVSLPRADAKRGATPKASTATPNAVVPASTAAGRGKLNVGASNGWCNVSVDGAARGATPVAGIELEAGSHKISCTTADGKTQSATVSVPADGVARYKFTL